jgi:hypothetical protein
VIRTNENEISDLSGNWNETDSQMVSQHMIKTLTDDSWRRTFVNRHGRKPVISIGTVSNKTTEHISTAAFTKDIEWALLQSKDMELVVSGNAQQEIRKERDNFQKYNQSPGGTRILKEKEVDFMLRGSIQSVEDQVTDIKTVFYQVDLELVSVATNETVWIGQKRIKKLIEQPLIKW